MIPYAKIPRLIFVIFLKVTIFDTVLFYFQLEQQPTYLAAYEVPSSISVLCQYFLKVLEERWKLILLKQLSG